MRIGQIAMEFMSFMIVGLLMAMLMLVVFVSLMKDSSTDMDASVMKDFGFSLQREIILASEVHEGYSREIFVPEYLGKREYTINNTERVLIITSDGITYPFPLPNINGTINKGYNTLKNIGGEIYIE